MYVDKYFLFTYLFAFSIILHDDKYNINVDEVYFVLSHFILMFWCQIGILTRFAQNKTLTLFFSFLRVNKNNANYVFNSNCTFLYPIVHYAFSLLLFLYVFFFCESIFLQKERQKKSKES